MSERVPVQRVVVKGKKTTVSTQTQYAVVPEAKLLHIFDSPSSLEPTHKYRVFAAKSERNVVTLKLAADESLDDAAATRFACATDGAALELVASLTASSSASSATAAAPAVEACQLCKKRKVKARVVLDGRVAMLCKACTLEQIALAKQKAAEQSDHSDDDEGEDDGDGSDDGGADGDEKRRHRRHHRDGAAGQHHHHRHHHRSSRAGSAAAKKDAPKAPSAPAPVPGKGTILPKLTPAKDKSPADAALDAKEQSKQGFAVRKAEADQYAWSSSDDDNDAKPHKPIKVSISRKPSRRDGADADGAADDDDDGGAEVLASAAKALSVRNTPTTSPAGAAAGTTEALRRRQSRQQHQRKDDFSFLASPSTAAAAAGGGAAPSTSSVLDLFDLSDFGGAGGSAALADIGDELLQPELLVPSTSASSATAATTSSLAGGFPDLDDLLSAPIVPKATAATATAVPAVVVTPVAPVAAAPSSEPTDAASLMRQCKAALDTGDLATSLSKAEQCVALVREQMRTADALGKATLESQLAYAAKYVSLLRLTKAALAIGPPTVLSKRASVLALIAAEIRVAAEHRAKAVRAAILRCGASKDFHSAAVLLRLLLSTNPPDAATLQQQLAKCEAEGEKNLTVPLSPTGFYCAASLEPLEHGPALRCKLTGVFYSLEAKMLSEECAWCGLSELENVTI